MSESRPSWPPTKPLPSWVATQYMEKKTKPSEPPTPIKFSPQQLGRPVSAKSSPGKAPLSPNSNERAAEEAEKPRITPSESSIELAKKALKDLFRGAGGDAWEFIRFASTGRKNPVRRWCTDEPLQYWEGVKLSDDSNSVCELTLPKYNLIGTITGSLGHIQHLEVLDLSTNELSGGIPREFSNLKNLKVLNLSNNKLSGSMDFAMALVKLQILDLGGNQFSSFIPEEASQLADLETLDVSRNSITGGIPCTIATLRRLKVLNLSSNALDGRVPRELVSMSERKPELEFLDLSGNKLDLPDGFTNEVWQRDPANPETRPPRPSDTPKVLGPIIGNRHIWHFWSKLFPKPDGEDRPESAAARAPQATLFTTPYVHEVKSPKEMKLKKLEESMREQGYSPAAIKKRITAEREVPDDKAADNRHKPKAILLPGLLVPQLDAPPPPPFGPRGEAHKQGVFLPPNIPSPTYPTDDADGDDDGDDN